MQSQWRERPSPEERDQIRVLVDAVAAADGTAAFAEPATLDLDGRRPDADTRHLLVRDADGALVAYAHVERSDDEGDGGGGAGDEGDGGGAGDEGGGAGGGGGDTVVELAVAPAHRGAGVGSAAADLLAAEVPGARAWAHGDHPGAARLAEREGLRRARELWRMRRPRSAGPLPPPREVPGVRIAALRPGVDEAAVVAVNNRAFAWHPEQSGWSVDEVAVIEAQPWFDAAGVLLAWDEATGALLGFHWTKVHERSASVPEPVGEVYVIGVDPGAQGRGLGGALTLAGLHHLAGRGLDEFILYVEGDNAAAVATYRRLGFARDAVDVSYEP